MRLSIYHSLDVASEYVPSSQPTCDVETLLPTIPLSTFPLANLLRPPVLSQAIVLVVIRVEIDAQGPIDLIRNLAPGA